MPHGESRFGPSLRALRRSRRQPDYAGRVIGCTRVRVRESRFSPLPQTPSPCGKVWLGARMQPRAERPRSRCRCA